MFIKSRDLFVKKWNEKNDLDINRFLEYFGAQWVNDVVVVITQHKFSKSDNLQIQLH